MGIGGRHAARGCKMETIDDARVTPAHLRQSHPSFAEAMTIYEEGSREYRNAMRELAK